MGINKITRKLHSTNTLCDIFMLSCAIGMALICYFAPIVSDDLFFATLSKKFFSDSHTFTQLIRHTAEYVKFIYNDENGRIANFLAPLFIVGMPRWLYAIITTIIFIMIFYYGSAMAEIKGDKTLTNLFICTIILVMPWFDSIFVTDYSLNYIFSLGLGTYIVFSFFQPPISILNKILTCIIAFPVGCWHESVELPFFAGMAMVLLYELVIRQKDSQLTFKIILVLLFYAAGYWRQVHRQSLPGQIAQKVSFKQED